jgi:intracellular septation protein
LFFGLAALNEIIWRFMSTETWVYFKTFGLTAAIFVFFISQAGLFKTYGIDEESEQSQG